MDKLIMIGISTIGGRAFYTALGHFDEAHSNPICLGHILADISMPWVIGAILATLMSNGSACLWGSISRMMFPFALKALGVEPDKVIFVDLKREKDVLWATEEALMSRAVIAEVRELTFT